MLLLQRVRNCSDDAEYEMLRQQWDHVNRPQYQRRTWSPRQEEVGAIADRNGPQGGCDILRSPCQFHDEICAGVLLEGLV